MTGPLPANNPLYPRSLFPNTVDTINDVPDSVADAVCAVQAMLLGVSGTPPLANMSAGSVTTGGATLRGGTGVPAAGLGANGDFFFRQDGGGAGATHIYFKNAGAWIGIA